jgi:pyridoxamine 5'-phosphate oxidase
VTEIDEPLEQFRTWFEQAKREEPFDATAMSLATVDAAGCPTVRMVLLKGADHRGFSFVTNYESRKARAIAETGRAALCIHWPKLERQVRVEGTVTRGSAEESDAYFATRPRGSQIGAWASLQSQVLPDRATLEARVAEVEQRFASRDVTRPEGWGLFIVAPVRIELWQGKKSRLHERTVYERAQDGTGWDRHALYP